MLLTLSALSPAASVYITGAGVLHVAGSGAAIGFIAGGVVAAMLALLYAELGAAFPGAGGVYPSLGRVLGPRGSFPCVALQMVTAPATMAFTAMGLADYVRVLAPSWPFLPVTFAALILSCVVAILRVRTGALITGIFLTIEMLALVIVATVALVHPARGLPEVLAHPVMLDHGALVPAPWGVVALAVVAGAYATAGANYALFFAEELPDAQRRMGRVTAWAGLLASLTIATPMVLIVLSASDLRTVLAAEAPIAAFLHEAGGATVAILVSGGVVAAIFNNLIACAMAYGRFIYATGRDGLWHPRVNQGLARLHEGWRSPVVATLILGAVAAAAVFLGERMLLIIISGTIFETLLMGVAILVGRQAGQTGRWFRIPAHPLVPGLSFGVVAAFAVADWFDPQSGRPGVLLLGSVFLTSLLYCQFRLRGAARPELA